MNNVQSRIAVLFAGMMTAASTAPIHAQFDAGIADNDCWVYTHAADPGGDPILRLWGSNGFDLDPTGYPGSPGTQFFFSYAYASWDLSDLPGDFRWNGATITLTVEGGSVYDPAVDDVYIRLITGPFEEDTFVFGGSPAPVSGDTNRLLGDDSNFNGIGSEITFEIPRNVPAQVLQKWAADRQIYVAITSTADFGTDGRFLRIASGENLLFDGPKLELR